MVAIGPFVATDGKWRAGLELDLRPGPVVAADHLSTLNRNAAGLAEALAGVGGRYRSPLVLKQRADHGVGPLPADHPVVTSSALLTEAEPVEHAAGGHVLRVVRRPDAVQAEALGFPVRRQLDRQVAEEALVRRRRPGVVEVRQPNLARRRRPPSRTTG